MHEGEESEYYLPAGRWTSFFHPERTLVGPTWVKEVVPMDEIPVWVRPGSVLALGHAGTGRPDYEYAKSVSLHAYEHAEGQVVKVAVPVGKGREIAGVITVQMKENVVSAEVTDGKVALAELTVFTHGKAVKAAADKDANTAAVRL